MFFVRKHMHKYRNSRNSCMIRINTFGCTRMIKRKLEIMDSLEIKKNSIVTVLIRCNRLSTVRRLGTLDGCRLGPDEDPPILHNVRRDRVVTAPPTSVKANLISPVLTLKEEKTVLPLGPEKAQNSHVSTVREEKSAVNQKQNQHTAKSKDPEPFALENCSPNVSVKNEVEKETGEENVQEELERKEELMRKEAAAAIREQLLFEEKDKAKKAEEKKKRNAEKAQARAQYWERKEAELKEKEREKREKKKARKKAKKNIIEGESSVCSSESTHTLPEPTIQESENEEKPKTLSTRPFKRDTEEKQSKSVSKRPQKPSTLLKLTKTIPIPSPLRKKTKKSILAWMWVLIGTLIVLAVVVLASWPLTAIEFTVNEFLAFICRNIGHQRNWMSLWAESDSTSAINAFGTSILPWCLKQQWENKGKLGNSVGRIIRFHEIPL
ncbi:hypothetical protein IFM89_024784 [Coptis chinensis]|uniref:Uncharacterized protein n=1 Tax=Coptis chinensis TaxID=261450 RepID=A0A835HPD4_9MAGN|nr:hypothetical protein IFM89_024784 [Coptis chinensis]